MMPTHTLTLSLQELVNLLVTGRAVSNVFNGTVQLDSGGDTKVPPAWCVASYITLL